MDRNVARAKYRVAFESIAGRYIGPLPAIVEAVEALPVTSVTLEGEGVICGPDGKSDFDRMRARFSRNGAPEAFLYAFDLLDLDGQDLRGKRWDHRRALLAQLLTGADEGHPPVRAHRGHGRRGLSVPPATWGWRASSRSAAIAATNPGVAGTWVKVKNPAHPAIERAMLITLSKRQRKRY